MKVENYNFSRGLFFRKTCFYYLLPTKQKKKSKETNFWNPKRLWV